MRMIFGLVLLLGIALAGGAVYMAKNYIGAYQAELARERAERAKIVPTVTIYVAQKALRYGDTLTREDVRAVKWPETAIPEGSFTDIDVLFPPDNTDARLVLRDMEPSEAILAAKVTEPGEDAGLTSRLERGMRAFAIRVDVASGVSGFLRPGDSVDVYWTGQVENGGDGRKEVTKMIEAAIRVIAIDQSAVSTNEATIARTVTVAVTPEQVGALALAQATGNLTLSLVGTGDDTVAGTIEVDQRRLLGLEEKKVAVQTAKEKVCTIRTRRGAEVMEIPIPCTN
ncbi:Flp pilus assembly protein CpaB [Sulfitobacter sp. LCG007]